VSRIARGGPVRIAPDPSTRTSRVVFRNR